MPIIHDIQFGMAGSAGMGGLSPTSRRTSVEQANEALTKAICSGELEPGQKLVFARLAKALRMSVTPVREALRQLERQGLVVDSPYAGMRVSTLSVSELVEVFEIRGMLDGFAVGRGLPRLAEADLANAHEFVSLMDEAIAVGDADRYRDLNRDFHDVLVARGAPPGSVLARLIDQNQARAQLYSAASRHTMSAEALRVSNDEHRTLLRLIEAGENERIEQLSRVHAATFAKNLADALAMTQ